MDAPKLPPGDPVARQLAAVAAYVRASNSTTAAPLEEVEVLRGARTPASNSVGAWLRVAHWLAAGVRVSLHQRNEIGPLASWTPSSRQYRLMVGALVALFNAAFAAGTSATYYLGAGAVADFVGRLGAFSLGTPTTSRTADRAELRRIYEEGIRIAAGNGVPGIARELQLLAAMAPAEDRDGADILGDIGGDILGEIPWWAWALGAAAVLWFVWPALAPAAAGTAAVVASRRS